MQEYKIVKRSVTPGATFPDGSGNVVQNITEFLDYINDTYLSQGYEIKHISEDKTYIESQGARQEFTSYTYHLIRNVPEAKQAKSKE